METLKQRLAKRLKELMRASVTANTQTRLAEISGVSQSSIQRVLTQEQSATVDVVEALALAFGVKQTHRFLLDNTEIQLLALWDRCTPQIQTQAMGFLTVASASGGVHGVASGASTGSHRVPPELLAAVMRSHEAHPVAEEPSVPHVDQHTHAPNSQKRKRSSA